MMPKVVICDSAIDAICHGAPLAVPGIAEVDTGIKRDMRVAIMSLKGEAVAIGISKLSTEEIIASREGIAVVLLRVLMSPGTYPCRWKTTK
jgi:H/ACA ribonucleoprotein complex subunit 4